MSDNQRAKWAYNLKRINDKAILENKLMGSLKNQVKNTFPNALIEGSKIIQKFFYECSNEKPFLLTHVIPKGVNEEDLEGFSEFGYLTILSLKSSQKQILF